MPDEDKSAIALHRIGCRGSCMLCEESADSSSELAKSRSFACSKIEGIRTAMTVFVVALKSSLVHEKMMVFDQRAPVLGVDARRYVDDLSRIKDGNAHLENDAVGLLGNLNINGREDCIQLAVMRDDLLDVHLTRADASYGTKTKHALDRPDAVQTPHIGFLAALGILLLLCLLFSELEYMELADEVVYDGFRNAFANIVVMMNRSFEANISEIRLANRAAKKTGAWTAAFAEFEVELAPRHAWWYGQANPRKSVDDAKKVLKLHGGHEELGSFFEGSWVVKIEEVPRIALENVLKIGFGLIGVRTSSRQLPNFLETQPYPWTVRLPDVHGRVCRGQLPRCEG